MSNSSFPFDALKFGGGMGALLVVGVDARCGPRQLCTPHQQHS